MTPSFTPNLGKVAKLSYGVVDRSLLRIVFVGEEIERGLVDLSVLRITVAIVKYLVYACACMLFRPSTAAVAIGRQATAIPAPGTPNGATANKNVASSRELREGSKLEKTCGRETQTRGFRSILFEWHLLHDSFDQMAS
jgi:hypothetical protein